ncbi:protein phosphatase 2C 43 [Artemisia annua]|uniref:protein-serine/threonine phosphatase n=1 Tax=Artemisia annua TaxID=35608 RepID=A0A2U1KFZ1_ARTAN|nr:protein phosphatase 2C 43 [Artemisia annua]
MKSLVQKFKSSLFARTNKGEGSSTDDHDDLLWSKDLEKHALGEFSFAVVQANHVLEDSSQVEIGQNATFVGVYDGHGGPEASNYVRDHLFTHLISFAKEKGLMSSEVFENAVSATEEGFLKLVSRTLDFKPMIAAAGSCCLAGFISEGTLCIANMGDSRAVLGRVKKRRQKKIVAEQITEDHNACVQKVRQELKSHHPDDPEIVVMKQGVWRIKGIIQISRSIGDAYLKKPEFALDPSFPRFHLPTPIQRPVIRDSPSIYTRELKPDDKFIVFASDGLWEHMTNRQVVKIVHKNPREGIARRLVKSAMIEAARKGKRKYDVVKKMGKGYRRTVHDDITVVVVFIDQQVNTVVDELSIRGFSSSTVPSGFTSLQGVEENAPQSTEEGS